MFKRFVNWVLGLLWRPGPDGERRAYLHAQNLNEDRDGNPKGWAYHGRSWLRTPLGTSRFEWHLWRFSAGLSLTVDSEDNNLVFHFAFPPVSFWLTLPVIPKRLLRRWDISYRGHTFFEFRVFDWAFWWQFGGNDFEWSSSTPKWKRGSFHVDDFFLGRMQYTEGKPEKHDVLIPMPEGSYKAVLSLQDDSWKRPRWFRRVVRRAHIDIPQGIPHEGKGENSWDCGEDRTYGLTTQAETVEAAIAAVVQSVLRSRRRYNGNINAKYPSPEQQEVLRALEKQRLASEQKDQSPPDSPASA